MAPSVLSKIPIYQMPSPPRSREHSPVRSQPSASPRGARKALSQLPQAPNRKHHLSGLPEPEAKRQTLAQRAGDFSSKNAAAPASKQPLNHAVATTAAAGPPRFSASTLTRPSPPRNKSITSFSASIGPSVRTQNHTASTLPRPSMASGRIPRQTRPNMSTTSVGLHNTTQRPSMLTPYAAALPNGLSNTSTTSNHNGSGQTPTASGKPIFPSFSALAVAAPLEHPSTQDIPRIGTRATSFRSKPMPVSPLPRCVSERRDFSITSPMRGLSLESSLTLYPSIREGSPSKLPRPVTPAPLLSPTPCSIPKSRQKHPPKLKRFLTRDSNTTAWDPDDMMASMERLMGEGLGRFQQTAQESSNMRDMLDTIQNQYIASEKSRSELTAENATLKSENARLSSEDARRSSENEGLRGELRTTGSQLNESRTKSALLHQEMGVMHRANDDLRVQITTATNKATHFETMIKQLESENHRQSTRIAVLEQMHSVATNASETSEKLLRAHGEKEQALQAKNDALEAKINALKRDHKSESERIKEANEDKETLLRDQMARLQALQAKIDFLESDSKSQSEHYAAMAREREAAISTADEATNRLRKEETLRRHLHNLIQELKGNIRVFCRVRPAISPDGTPSKQAQLTFPDTENSTKIEVRGPDEKSSLGKNTTKTHPFTFDRVFSPKSTNQDVFDEVSQLIQSSLDGYNVCIFAYGQTGSGKTYTMSAEDGMIPKALHMIYNNTKDLENRGWKYSMSGSFVEVYNESIHDLLGKSSDKEKKKLEIKHDVEKCETTITNVTVVNLDSTEEVESILARAMAKRSVAATQANERSSRSHSVFMLSVIGENTITGEQSKGTLNLVDLAGSERLDQSKAEGARLKETQSINRSLSSLGDVIGALGQGKEGGHVPYRNSKLTNLLQFSLGGNSKTLMFCMVSPLKDHLMESLTTLRFAAKVNNTHIGRASKA